MFQKFQGWFSRIFRESCLHFPMKFPPNFQRKLSTVFRGNSLEFQEKFTRIAGEILLNFPVKFSWIFKTKKSWKLSCVCRGKALDYLGNLILNISDNASYFSPELSGEFSKIFTIILQNVQGNFLNFTGKFFKIIQIPGKTVQDFKGKQF